MTHDGSGPQRLGRWCLRCLAIVAIVVVATGGLASCSSESSSVSRDSWPAEPAEVPAGVIGATEAEAIAIIEGAGLTYRVLRADGSPITDDYSPIRVNLDVENGRVVAAEVY